MLLVVAPLVVALVAGTALMAAGFVRLGSGAPGKATSRDARRSHVTCSTFVSRPLMVDRREAVVPKGVGAFSLLYAVLTAAQLACHVYTLVASASSDDGLTQRIRSSSCCTLLVMQGVSGLVLGVASGVWIGRQRTTIRSWRILLGRLCSCRRHGGSNVSNDAVNNVDGWRLGNSEHAMTGVHSVGQDRRADLLSARYHHRYQQHHHHYHYHHPDVNG